MLCHDIWYYSYSMHLAGVAKTLRPLPLIFLPPSHAMGKRWSTTFYQKRSSMILNKVQQKYHRILRISLLIILRSCSCLMDGMRQYNIDYYLAENSGDYLALPHIIKPSKLSTGYKGWDTLRHWREQLHFRRRRRSLIGALLQLSELKIHDLLQHRHT